MASWSSILGVQCNLMKLQSTLSAVWLKRLSNLLKTVCHTQGFNQFNGCHIKKLKKLLLFYKFLTFMWWEKSIQKMHRLLARCYKYDCLLFSVLTLQKAMTSHRMLFQQLVGSRKELRDGEWGDWERADRKRTRRRKRTRQSYYRHTLSFSLCKLYATILQNVNFYPSSEDSIAQWPGPPAWTKKHNTLHTDTHVPWKVFLCYVQSCCLSAFVYLTLAWLTQSTSNYRSDASCFAQLVFQSLTPCIRYCYLELCDTHTWGNKINTSGDSTKKVLKMVRPLQRTLAFSLVHWKYILSSIWYISDTFCIITAAAINSENQQTHTHACVSLLLMLSTTSIQWTSNMQSILQWHYITANISYAAVKST